MQKTNLIIVYPNQFGYHTDSYKYCQYLPSEYQITYICFDQGFERLTLPNVDVIYVPYNIGKFKRLIAYFQTIFKTCNSHPDNILFTIQFKFSFLIGMFAKSKLKILDYRTGDLNNNPLKRWFYNRCMWFDALFFQRVSVITEGLRKLLWLSKKTAILPLGADVISVEKKNFETFHLLYVGAILHRNIFQTIEGFSLFKEKYQLVNIQYTIIGFGNESDIELLNQYIKRFKLEESVFYLGRKKVTELTSFFNQCNIGISYIPLKPYYQHQPATKTFEYALSGLYTIATNTYENQQVIDDSNGVLCNDNPEAFAQALGKAYENRLKINEQQVRDSLKHYHWKAIVERDLVPLFNL